jgi:hypothetical protein
VRRIRPAFRRGIRIRKRAYPQWQSVIAQIESMKSRIVLAAPIAASDTLDVHMNSIPSMSLNDSDPDLDPPSVSPLGISPIHGELLLNSDGFFQYTPTRTFVRSDSFSFQTVELARLLPCFER